MGRAKNQLAGIQYFGIAGISKECQDAVIRLIQYGDEITFARILSCSGTHCLLLTVNVAKDLIAVKSGFGSGYSGEGAGTFSYVLQLLEAHGVEIEEYEVDEDFIERVDASALTQADIDLLDSARPVRPRRWHNYVFERHWSPENKVALWKKFRAIIPFAIIDDRIMDLAISFWDGPDEKLLTGYRRLEDTVRQRTGIAEIGNRLFSQAFQNETARLGWKDIDGGEQVGRGQLFIAAYLAYRNRRAHREPMERDEHQLTEFLLLNHLFLLEKECIELVPKEE